MNRQSLLLCNIESARGERHEIKETIKYMQYIIGVDEHVYGVISGNACFIENDTWAEYSTVLKVLPSGGWEAEGCWEDGFVGTRSCLHTDLETWGGRNIGISGSHLTWLERAAMRNEPWNGCWIWSPGTGKLLENTIPAWVVKMEWGESFTFYLRLCCPIWIFTPWACITFMKK